MKKPVTAALALCLFLLVVGAKWATFDRFGSPMPDWDQWDAEAGETIIPWLDRENFLQHLFHPHNEHRVVLTKLQNLLLCMWNGQWDSRVQAAANAMLHAGFVVAFWLAACRWVGRRWHAPLFLLAFALFALPVAWQNVLGGFHSQQYWLLALSFFTIVALPFARPWSARWWAGALAATLALGSMGSGFIAAAVVLLVVGWRLWTREAIVRTTWPTLAFCALLVAFGLVTRVEVAWHQDIKAKTAHDFFFSIIHSLEWPLRHHHWAALVMWLPWLLVAWRVALRNTGPDSRVPQTLVALGGWVLVQIVATAYARGVGAEYPASRYMDTLAFGTMANGIAAAWLLGQTKRPRDQETKRPSPPGERPSFGPLVSWSLGLLVCLAAAWLGTFGFGLRKLLDDVLRIELPDARKYYVKAEGHMRRYLATLDPKHLAYPDIPYPSAQGLIDRLVHPGLRAMMPVPLRPPLELLPGPPSNAFLWNDARYADPAQPPPRLGMTPATPPLDHAVTWGSFGPDGVAGSVVGEWRSAQLTSPLGGWLTFEAAGFLGEPNEGGLLELRSAATDEVLARVRPSRVPGDSWRSAYVRAPAEPFIVVARDLHAARWFAFSGPAEMGTLSYLAWRANKHGLLIMAGGAAGALLICGWLLLARAAPAPDRLATAPAGVAL